MPPSNLHPWLYGLILSSAVGSAYRQVRLSLEQALSSGHGWDCSQSWSRKPLA
jgi:hypothetical protein